MAITYNSLDHRPSIDKTSTTENEGLAYIEAEVLKRLHVIVGY
jgi:hypothetical protein